MLDTTTHTLFFYYPRTAGIPQLYKLRNEKELEKYIATHNGTPRGCHVSLYDITRRPTIDKLLFDFDSKNLFSAYEEVCCFVSELRKKKLPFIPVFSGRKGFHVYVMLNPIELDCDSAMAVLRIAQLSLIGNGNSSEYKTVDPHKIGAVRTMIRIPNTLNGSRFCVYLPSWFDELKLSEIVKLSSEPRYYSYDTHCDKSVLDVANVNKDEIPDFTCDLEPPAKPAPAIPKFEDLVDLIRPCIFYEVQKFEPLHAVRVEFVSELMWLGHTPQQIFNIIKTLKWSDFDPRVTMYHIDYIFRRRIAPYSCRKLREFVKCTKCGWKYWWRDVDEGTDSNGFSQEKLDGHCVIC